MRPEPNRLLDMYREIHPTLGLSESGRNHGYFQLGPLRIISSGSIDAQTEWEHVSVSCANRCPTGIEMDIVKQLFWENEETVIQFHPPQSKRVNINEFTLHLWRNRFGHPLPPQKSV